MAAVVIPQATRYRWPRASRALVIGALLAGVLAGFAVATYSDLACPYGGRLVDVEGTAAGVGVVQFCGVAPGEQISADQVGRVKRDNPRFFRSTRGADAGTEYYFPAAPPIDPSAVARTWAIAAVVLAVAAYLVMAGAWILSRRGTVKLIASTSRGIARALLATLRRTTRACARTLRRVGIVPVILAAIVAALVGPSVVALATQAAALVDGEACATSASTEWLSFPMRDYGLPDTETRLTDRSAMPITWAVYVRMKCP